MCFFCLHVATVFVSIFDRNYVGLMSPGLNFIIEYSLELELVRITSSTLP